MNRLSLRSLLFISASLFLVSCSINDELLSKEAHLIENQFASQAQLTGDAVQPNTFASKIVTEGVKKEAPVSAARYSIFRQIAELNIQKKKGFPALYPSATLNSDKSSSMSLNSSIEIFDYGEKKSGLSAAETLIHRAVADYWKEANGTALKNLERYSKVVVYNEQLHHLKRSVKNLKDILAISEKRTSLGMTSDIEMDRIKLAVSQMEMDILLNKSQVDANLKLLENRSGVRLSASKLPSTINLSKMLKTTPAPTSSPDVTLGNLDLVIARVREKQATARVFPNLVLGAGLTASGLTYNLSLGGSNSNPFALSASVSAARESVKAAEGVVNNIKDNEKLSKLDMQITLQRLAEQLRGLNVHEKLAQSSVAKFEELFSVGQRGLEDGLAAYETLSSVEAIITKTQGDIFIQKARLAHMSGTLVKKLDWGVMPESW